MNNNTTNFSSPDFPAAPNLSVKQEQDISYEETFHYQILESKSRDLSVYPSPSDYRINFGSSLRNIKEIELIGGTIPDTNSVLNEPYLSLEILDIENLEAADTNRDKAFSILQLQTPTTAAKFINISNSVCQGTKKIFKNPLASLNRMHIRIKDLNNNIFNFGDDTTGGPNKSLQNVFIFKITTLEKSRVQLQNRGVF